MNVAFIFPSSTSCFIALEASRENVTFKRVSSANPVLQAGSPIGV